MVSGWFSGQVVHTGRLPLFCFFVAFVTGFTSIRISVRMIRAGVRWWPGNLVAGAVHVHHMVFGVVLMAAAASPGSPRRRSRSAWRAAAAGVFGLGTALVLDEFALILHLRDVYWANEGRLSVDAVFVAAGDHGAAADRRHPGRCRERGQLSPHARQPGGRVHAGGDARRPVRAGRSHAAQGQAVDRAARPGHTARR